MASRPDRSGNFRQIRLTATHELPSGKFRNEGRFSWSVCAKPLNEEWKQLHVVDRGASWAPSVPLETYEDVVLALVEILEGLLVPIHGTTDRE